jgi:methyltransferase (TIGR00027 family)
MLEGVSGTGLTVAGIRAEETARPDRLFADPLAAAFVAATGSPRSRATSRQAAALRLWIVARTVFLDELITGACADGVRQAVRLGAGFDTRASRPGPCRTTRWCRTVVASRTAADRPGSNHAAAVADRRSS